jgi:hypothetical protein
MFDNQIVSFEPPGDIIAYLSGCHLLFVGKFLDIFFVQSKFQKRNQKIYHLHKTDDDENEIKWRHTVEGG